MFTSILLIVIFFACFTSFMNSGMWSNTIALVNVLTAGLLATNYFEPLADYFEGLDSSFTYVWDFVALWVLFGGAMLLLRMATDFMSPLRVKFYVPVEKVGGPFMAIWVSWIIVCFTTMTLHTAPLARNFLGGSFQSDPDARMLFGLGPDRVWLGWVHRESRGALSRLGQLAPFDPRGEFIYRYADRRAEFEKLNGLSPAAGQRKGAK
ncbi:MAG TPA: hypothetical protein VL175_19905 [Pirellulales bacterium]|jgi:hypothetical protein|nr:hypothetical protein [Pirellulales bacterium]